MTIFCTSDEHFSHGNIIRLADRPFSSVEEMDQAMIDRWNAIVGPKDTVYVVGDFAMGKIAESLPIALQLQGRKRLVPGNHDRVWCPKNQTQLDRWVREYQDVGFTIEPHQIMLDGFLVCHFPYEGDSHEDDRYVDFRPLRRPGVKGLIHGHVHEQWKVNGDQINVGVDVWDFTPVSLDQIKLHFRLMQEV